MTEISLYRIDLTFIDRIDLSLIGRIEMPTPTHRDLRSMYLRKVQNATKNLVRISLQANSFLLRTTKKGTVEVLPQATSFT